MGLSEPQRGVMIALIGVLCVSPDSLLLRAMAVVGGSLSAIVFWKLLIAAFLIGGWVVCSAALEHRSAARGAAALWAGVRTGPRHMAAGVALQAGIDIGFSTSMLETTAARAILLVSLNPIWAAVIGRVALAEALPRRTVAAIAVAVGAMLLAFVPSLAGADGQGGGGEHGDGSDSGERAPSARGDATALATGVLIAAFLTLVRSAGGACPDAPMPLASAVGALVGAACALALPGGGDDDAADDDDVGRNDSLEFASPNATDEWTNGTLLPPTGDGANASGRDDGGGGGGLAANLTLLLANLTTAAAGSDGDDGGGDGGGAPRRAPSAALAAIGRTLRAPAELPPSFILLAAADAACITAIFIALAIAPRYVPSARVALVMLLEVRVASRTAEGGAVRGGCRALARPEVTDRPPGEKIARRASGRSRGLRPMIK